MINFFDLYHQILKQYYYTSPLGMRENEYIYLLLSFYLWIRQTCTNLILTIRPAAGSRP